MSDRIEKCADLKAPVDRVWRALTNHEQFGTWFKARLDQPFRPGEASTGNMTYPGYEHVPWKAKVEVLDEPRAFSFRWAPYDDTPGFDYASLPWNLVEFRLEPSEAGTRLSISESGFDALPEGLREKMYRDNQGGWDEQVKNIRAYVER